MSYIISLIKTTIYRILHKTILFRFGFGNRVGKGVWEKEYKDNRWEYLEAPEQKEHYDAIIKQIDAIDGKPVILDIGSGHGVLYTYFRNILKPGFNYKGIDISENAIVKALHNHPEADFEVVDYDFKKVEGKFNVIVFNEVLYYFVKPIKTLLKALKENLTANGVVIISMYQDDQNKNDLIWKEVDGNFKVLNTQIVENKQGVRWIIKTITLAIANLFLVWCTFSTMAKALQFSAPLS
jgi:2-polyprenyl-3-methyl-5-hydroxy-6-metoxy-1,4-benzoquinol methylase